MTRYVRCRESKNSGWVPAKPEPFNRAWHQNTKWCGRREYVHDNGLRNLIRARSHARGRSFHSFCHPRCGRSRSQSRHADFMESRPKLRPSYCHLLTRANRSTDCSPPSCPSCGETRLSLTEQQGSRTLRPSRGDSLPVCLSFIESYNIYYVNLHVFELDFNDSASIRGLASSRLISW